MEKKLELHMVIISLIYSLLNFICVLADSLPRTIQIQIQKFYSEKKCGEHQNILTAVHDQD